MLDSQPGIDAVKAIREVYDPAEGTHRDYVIYKSADAPIHLDEEESHSGGYGGRSDWHDEDDDGGAGDDYGGTFGGDQFDADDDDWGEAPKKKKAKPKKNKKPTTITTLLIKLLLVTLFSICLAAIFTVSASTILHGTTLFGVKIVGNAEGNLLFLVFVSTFLISATAMAFTFLRGDTLAERQRKARDRAQARATRVAAKQQKQQQQQQKKAEKKSRAAMEKAARDELDRAMEGIDEFKITEEQKEAEGEAASERLKDAIKGEESEKGGTGEVLDTDAGAASESLSPHAEKQKAYMMKFLDEALDGAQGDAKKLDNFNKFGVNLFLAGACETLADKRELDGDAHAKVLADSVRVMGFKKSHATTFADKYEEYLMQDARYMQMFQAGRNSMNSYFQDETAAKRHLESALGEWNKPKPKEEQSGPVTVLFTDIAGSTAMTQALGDAGAQEVVRAHNRVVRDALTDHGGREVKHTGDGIMASFGKVTDSVDAAIKMQRSTMVHNAQYPDLPLHLKIGINAGEPIAEDNDLFGTTVQLSARIVDKAKADQIFVSEIVRGICAGKSYKFINQGGYAMKGFADDLTLYEVVWREDEGQEAAE